MKLTHLRYSHSARLEDDRSTRLPRMRRVDERRCQLLAARTQNERRRLEERANTPRHDATHLCSAMPFDVRSTHRARTLSAGGA